MLITREAARKDKLLQNYTFNYYIIIHRYVCCSLLLSKIFTIQVWYFFTTAIKYKSKGFNRKRRVSQFFRKLNFRGLIKYVRKYICSRRKHFFGAEKKWDRDRKLKFFFLFLIFFVFFCFFFWSHRNVCGR